MGLRHKYTFNLFCVAGTIACSSVNSSASSVYWIGPNAGDWSVAANWTGSVLPSTNSDIILNEFAKINFDVANVEINSLELKPSNIDESTEIDMTNGNTNLRINNDLIMSGGTYSSIILANGHSDLYVGGDITIGKYAAPDGFGAVKLMIGEDSTLTTGVNNYTIVGATEATYAKLTLFNQGAKADIGSLDIGLDGGRGEVLVEVYSILNSGSSRLGIGNINSYGMVNVATEAKWNVSADVVAGVDGIGNITLSNGGTLVLNSNKVLTLAENAGSVGQLVIGADSDHNAAATGNLTGGSITFGQGDGSIEFNHTNTDYEFSQAVSGSGSIKHYAGHTTLSANNADKTSFLVAGGTLVLTGNYSSSDSTVAVTGGTLQVGNGAEIGEFAGAANIGESGTLSFSRSNDLTYSGVIGGTGTLQQAGGGDLILTANSSGFEGTVTVDNGTLTVGGQLGGDVTVKSGATLKGSGILHGDVSINSGGILSGTSAQKLSFANNLTLNSGSNVEVAFTSAGLNELFEVSGDLSLDGTLNVSSFGDPAVGVFKIFKYGGNVVGNFSSFIMPSGVDDDKVEKSTANGYYTLTNNSGLILNYWDGDGPHDDGILQGGDGTWNATNKNWTAAPDYSVNGQWESGQFAYFGAAAGTVKVDNVGGQVTTSGMQFDTTGYRVEGTTEDDAILLVADSGNPNEKPVIRVGSGESSDLNKIATIATKIIGSSGLQKTFSGTLILTGDNSYTGGTDIHGGILQLGDGNTPGSIDGDVNIGSGAKLVVNKSGDTEFSSVISGDGAVEIDGGGETTFTGNNTYSGGTKISSGTLRIGQGESDGSIMGDVNIAVADAFLIFNRDNDYKFSGSISGAGGVTQAGTGKTILIGDNNYQGGTQVNFGILQVGDGQTTGSITGDVKLGINGGLAFSRSDEITYSGIIDGAGTLYQVGNGNLKLTGNSHDFTGATHVQNGMLTVDGNLGGTVDTYSGTRLAGIGKIVGRTSIGANSTLVGSAPDKLSFGGDLVFDADSLLELSFGGKAGDELFDVAGNLQLAGKVNVLSFGDTGPGIYRIFKYSNGLSGGLIAGTMPSGVDASKISFLDENQYYSLVNSNGAMLNIWDGATGHNNGVIDGGDGIWNRTNDNWTQLPDYEVNGSWDDGQFAFFSGTAGKVQVDNSGGMVTTSGIQFDTSGYEIAGLTTSDVLTLISDPEHPDEKTIIRVGSSDGTDASKISTISVVLDGTSGLQKTFAGTLILTGENTYTGDTDVVGGSLQIGAGGTSGSIQGDVNISEGALLAFNRSDDLMFDGDLSGEGSVTQSGSGSLTLSGDNSFEGNMHVASGELKAGASGTVFGHGALDIDAGAKVNLADFDVSVFGLEGAGSIDLGGGSLNVDQIDDTAFSGSIQGAGSLTKDGEGTLTLSGKSSYTGNTEVFSGILHQGASGSFSEASNFSVGQNGILAIGGFDTSLLSLINKGTISLNHEGVGTTLTVINDYVGQDGELVINSVLGADNSITDKLVIKGNSSGNTYVTVNNAGGKGDKTQNGIKIIEVEGDSNGTFDLDSDYLTKDGKKAVVAGAYAYTLQSGGDVTGNDGNWYLVSSTGDTPGPLISANVPVYEAYRETMNSLMQMPSLQQRVGDRLEQVNAPKNESEKTTPSPEYIWARIDGTHSQVKPSSTTGMTHDINTVIFQSGVDGLFYDGELGKLVAGLYGSYGTARSDILSKVGDGNISTDAWTLGGTVTWYAAEDFYIDAQAQTTWFESDLFSETTRASLSDGQKAQGYALSLETGKKFELTEHWSITPQMQLSWSTINADSSQDKWNTKFKLNDNDRTIGRVGVNLEYKDKKKELDNTYTVSKGYIIANLIRDFQSDKSVNVSGENFVNDNRQNWAEVGAGVDYSWKDSAYAVYGEGALKTALEDASDNYTLKGSVGFRMRW